MKERLFLHIYNQKSGYMLVCSIVRGKLSHGKKIPLDIDVVKLLVQVPFPVDHAL